MAVNVGEAFVTIRPETGNFAREAQSKITAPLNAAFAGISTAVVGQKIGQFFRSAFDEATEASKVLKQTEAVLKSTGGAAGITADHIGDLAGKLSDLAAIDDEVIQQGENVLLTFTNIRNEAGKGNDIFDQATEAALNLSVALGTDMQGAVIQVGKALNDPIAGVTALTRVGVSFTEQQKEQIRTLVESGNVLGAQKIILQELQKEFGGAAASQATAAAKLQVAFGNLKESIGTALLPIINGLAKALRPLAEFLSENRIAATVLAVVISGALLAALAGYTIRMAQATIATLTFGSAQKSAATSSEQLAGATATAGSRFGGLTATIGSAIPIIGAAVTAGLGLSAVLQKIQGNGLNVDITLDSLANHSKRLDRQLGDLRDGLAGLKDAMNNVDARTAIDVQKAYGKQLDDVKDKLRALAMESPTLARDFLEHARAAGLSKDVMKELTKVVEDAERARVRAAAAADKDAAALRGETNEAGKLTLTYEELIDVLNDHVDAQLNSEGAAISMDRSIENLNKTLAETALTTLEGREAFNSAKESVVNFGQAIYDENVATKGAEQATRDQIGALAGVRDSLAPGSPLRAFLDGYINDLNNRIPHDVSTNFDINVVVHADALARQLLGASPDYSVGLNYDGSIDYDFDPTTPMASGGLVSSGRSYIVGEQGPELFVPGSSGAIIPNDALGAGVTVNMYGNMDTDPVRYAYLTGRTLLAYMSAAGR